MTTSVLTKPAGEAIISSPRIPDGFRSSVSPSMIRTTREWLDRQHGAASLGLLLRMDPDLANLSPDDRGWRVAVRNSARRKTEQVRWAMQYAVPENSPWREAVTEFPAIHCCAVRGPIPYLKNFLDSHLFQKREDVVAGILLNAPMRIPECTTDQAPYDAETQRADVERLLRLTGGSPPNYLHHLGIGDFHGRWKDVTGRGQCVCILDSGVDESHPALQRSVRAHALFDAHGNYKHSIYALDRGCHGSKTTGLILARVASGFDLGHNIEGDFRLGMAPDAQAVMVNVLQGEYRQEGGHLKQFLAGLDWAVEHQFHPQFGGYELVSISIEVHSAFTLQVNKVVDDLLGFMRACRLVPLLAAGNRGDESTPLGTQGAYVGACNTFGKPWSQSGPAAHLLAPGVRLICCQPPVSQLGENLVGIHTGTSLSTAIAAGAILLLCEASRRSAGACLTALVQTRNAEKVISLDKALDYLEATPFVPDFDPKLFP